MADITGKTKRAEETHYVSINDGGTQQGNYNNDGATADDSLAIGAGASASSESGVSIGHGAHAIGGASRVSIGKNAGGYSANPNGISIGTDARGGGGVAIGFGSISTSEEGVAIGGGQLASHGAQAQVYSVSIGASTKSEQSGVAIGYARQVPHNAVAVGANNVIGVATGEGSAAIGMDAYGSGADSTALGRLARAKQDGSVAIGHESEADIPAGVAGYDPATAAQSTSTAREWVSNRAAVSVGSMTLSNATERETRQITSLAAGTSDTDAVNVAQLKAVRDLATSGGATPSTYFHVNTGDAAQPVGDATTNLGSPESKSGATGTNATTAGVGATGAGYSVAAGAGAAAKSSGVAVGESAATLKGQSISIGRRAQTKQQKSIAIGATGAAGTPTVANSVGSIAIGNEAQAGADATTRQTVAIGTGTKATGNQATAIGAGALADGESSIAIGNDDVVEMSKRNTDGTTTTTVNGGSIAAAYVAITAQPHFVDPSNYYVPTNSAGQGAVAVGTSAEATGLFSMALGLKARAIESLTMAIGAGATAHGEGAIAFGIGAIANRPPSFVDSTVRGYDPATGAPATSGTLYEISSSVAEVSFGRHGTINSDGIPTNFRFPQLTHVAPGTKDWDVATVGQLRRIMDVISNPAQQGGTLKVDSAAAYTVQEWDYAIVNTYAGGNKTLNIPHPAAVQGRTLRIVNQATAYQINLNFPFKNYQGVDTTIITTGEWYLLHSDGMNWYTTGWG